MHLLLSCTRVAIRVNILSQLTISLLSKLSPMHSHRSSCLLDGGMQHKLLDQIFNLDFISTWNDPDFDHPCEDDISSSSRIGNFGNESHFERNCSPRISFFQNTFCKNPCTSNCSWIRISHWKAGLFNICLP